MAFVAFGKKKVSNAQQQPAGSKNPAGGTASASDPAEDETSLQEQNPQVQGVANNNIEGLKASENLEMFDDDDDDDGLLTIGGEHGAAEHFPGAAFCESPTFAAAKQQHNLVDSDCGGGIPQILEHNVALRRNFDNLKQLHLQLTEANTQLQEAFLTLQDDKRLRHVKELSLLKSEHNEIAVLAQELEQRNRSLEQKMASVKGENRELIQKLDSARYGHQIQGSGSHLCYSQLPRVEKEKVLVAKHTAELEYTRELSIVKVDDHTFRQQAADLAHKCKHLEIDLEKAIAAGDTVRQQVISLAYEKDSTIMDLEQALRRVREDLQAAERKRRANESDWQIDRQKLQSKLDEKERGENMLKSTIKEEADQKLKEASREISELRAMLVTLEKPRADAELLHLETVRQLTKERETLRQELGTALAAHKEASDHLTKMEQIRIQLSDALAQNYESSNQIADCKKARVELEKSSETLKCQLVELGALRDSEHHGHARQLEDEQRKWAAEKSALLIRTERTFKEVEKDYNCKTDSLKKKLKQTQKLLATLTVDRNQLLVRVRECEAQLAIAQSTRVRTPTLSTLFSKIPISVDYINSTRLREEIKEVGERQAKYFTSPDTVFTPRGSEYRAGL